jgi:hypothetical protein
VKLLNEATAVTLNIERRGDDGSLITPTSLKYRVDNQTNNQVVTDWATLTPAATTTVVIPATSNAIQNDGNSFEDVVVTVMTDEGLDTQETNTQTYRVRNLGGVL